MPRPLVRAVLAPFAVLALPVAAAAQEPADSAKPGIRIHLLPSMSVQSGVYMGLTGSGGATGFADLGGTRAHGLAAEVSTPLPWLSLRAGVSVSRPDTRIATGPDEWTFSNSAVRIATLDLVARGPRVLDAQPYVVLGGGLKQYDFDQRTLRNEGASLVPEDEIVPVLRLGAGVAWDVGRYEIYLEGGTHLSRFPDRGATPRGSDRIQHDGYLTLGLRIPIN